MLGPDPDNPYPFRNLPYSLANLDRTIFLKHFIKRKNISVGDYTYYDHPDNPVDFENENVLYHYDFSKEKLVLGRFCMLATGTKFIMSAANHKLDGFSTYPFGIFANGWEKDNDLFNLLGKGDTVVGNDVWFGYDSTILPGITISDGAIIGAKSVVTKNVPPYAVVGGNPARILKIRLNDDVINLLLKIKWWNWSREKISENIKNICNLNIDWLKKTADSVNL